MSSASSSPASPRPRDTWVVPSRACWSPLLGTLLLFVLEAPRAMAGEVPGENVVTPYVRGAVPNWMIPARNRANGVTYLGSHERLRVAVDKLLRGVPTLVAVAGGSNTVGHGAIHGFPWPRYVYNWLSDAFPDTSVTLHNGAVPGTSSAYMSVCYNVHIPKNASIVILEYSHNDVHTANPPMDKRREFERLLRKVLAYPARPAVILLNVYVWHESMHPTTREAGVFWDNAERDFTEFSLYYELPALSVRGCCYHLMRAGLPGFRIDYIRRDADVEGLKGKTWYSDGVHCAGDTGYRGLGELNIHLIMETMAGLRAKPLGPADHAVAAAPLPPPMVPGNWPSSTDRCFVGTHLVQALHGVPGAGWAYIDESANKTNHNRQPKLGFVSTTVGSTVAFKIDTSSYSNLTSDHDRTDALLPGGAAAVKAKVVAVALAHLRSYEHMGRATVTCTGGCVCTGDLQLEGYQERRVSQMHVHSFAATQARKCIVSVTVIAGTTTGEHKVKIQGLFVSEEAEVEHRLQHMAGIVTTGVLDNMQNYKAKALTLQIDI